ncbi:hypothetical protein ABW21_db0209213 [Orbilia brochopaga]|nr:hypothetical protein ABW21_db0209213 [Drechslerella brochopaga]
MAGVMAQSSSPKSGQIRNSRSGTSKSNDDSLFSLAPHNTDFDISRVDLPARVPPQDLVELQKFQVQFRDPGLQRPGNIPAGQTRVYSLPNGLDTPDHSPWGPPLLEIDDDSIIYPTQLQFNDFESEGDDPDIERLTKAANRWLSAQFRADRNPSKRTSGAKSFLYSRGSTSNFITFLDCALAIYREGRRLESRYPRLDKSGISPTDITGTFLQAVKYPDNFRYCLDKVSHDQSVPIAPKYSKYTPLFSPEESRSQENGHPGHAEPHKDILKPADPLPVFGGHSTHVVENQSSNLSDHDIVEESTCKLQAAVLHLLLIVAGSQTKSISSPYNYGGYGYCYGPEQTTPSDCQSGSNEESNSKSSSSPTKDPAPSNSSSSNSKRGRLESSDEGEDNGSDESGPPRKRRISKTIEAMGRNLACPFAKGQPQKHSKVWENREHSCDYAMYLVAPHIHSSDQVVTVATPYKIDRLLYDR